LSKASLSNLVKSSVIEFCIPGSLSDESPHVAALIDHTPHVSQARKN
jgi:hypothetical protein